MKYMILVIGGTLEGARVAIGLVLKTMGGQTHGGATPPPPAKVYKKGL